MAKGEDSLLIPFRIGKVYPLRTKKAPLEQSSTGPNATELASPVAVDEFVIELDEEEAEMREATIEEEAYQEYCAYQNQQDAYEMQKRLHRERYSHTSPIAEHHEDAEGENKEHI